MSTIVLKSEETFEFPVATWRLAAMVVVHFELRVKTMGKKSTSSRMSQNPTHWNLDFSLSPGTLFQGPTIQYYVIYNKDKSAQHLFEQI